MRRIICSLALLLCLTLPARAASIVVGTHFLFPNMPNQVVDLFISGNEMFAGLNLYMTINGGVGPAPLITAIDVTGPGTIFAGNNIGQPLFGPPVDPPSLEPAVYTTTISGNVQANGLLARVTFDTTGLFGTWTWSLTDNMLGPTALLTNPSGDAILPSVQNGTVIAFPEPASWALGCCALAALAVVAAKRTAGARAAARWSSDF